MTLNSIFFNASTFYLTLLISYCFALQDEIDTKIRVPLLINEITELRCSLGDSISKWTFKDTVIETSRKYSFSDDNKILKIHRSHFSDEGTYNCLNEETKTQQTFLVKGKPRFKITSKYGKIDVNSIHAREGSTIDMVCYIPSKPEIPSDEFYNFTWYKGDSQMSATAENQRSNTLTIINVTHNDRDIYKCIATNGVLNHTEKIHLRVKDAYGYVWPLICIVCELVILILVIFMFENRGVKPEYEEYDENNANRKSSITPASRN